VRHDGQSVTPSDPVAVLSSSSDCVGGLGGRTICAASRPQLAQQTDSMSLERKKQSQIPLAKGICTESQKQRHGLPSRQRPH
jgi:hypothetical protein